MDDEKNPPKRGTGATLKEIALRVGVNPTTVAVVLNKTNSGTRVSGRTRDAILAAARELGYQPNHLAQSLRRGRTGQIGLYSGYGFLDVRSPFLGSVVAGITDGCEEHGFDLVLKPGRQKRPVDEVLQSIHGGRIDGLLIVAPPGDPVGQRMDESHLPAVAIGDPVADLPSVVSDDLAGGKLLARKLVEAGHRRILFRAPEFPFKSVDARFAGLREGIQAGGGTLIELPFSASLADAMASGGAERVTAIACWEDECAYATITELRAAGRRVPQDVAVTGYDGPWLVVPPFVRLTTIDARWYDVARAAVGVLHARISGQAVRSRTVLPIEFVPGETL
jgi:DNA-binding LacI/PurR family transcriptional regulator